MKRIAAIYILLFMALFGGVCRLLWLTTSESSVRAAANQGTVRLDMATSRGVIYDRNKKPITDTQEYYLALCTPTPEAAAALAELPGSEAALARLRQGRPACMEVPRVIEAKGVTIYKLKRRYADAQAAAHLIGYLDSTKTEGVAGIEKSYDDILRGGSLFARFAIDARGEALTGVSPEIANEDYYNTGSVRLTLDLDIQKIAEKAASRRLSAGAVVILEVGTGKILASVSVPGFSPNSLGRSVNSEGAPLINRAFYPYNVGSVFKLIVAAAALEQGVSPATTFYCRGKLQVGNLVFNCHGKHGTIDMAGAIRDSCNLYFIELAKRIGADPIHRTASALGFGQSRSVCRGIVPQAGTLTSLPILRDQPAALANFAFGQGDLMLTPLQIATMTAAIAGGGRAYAPSLVESAVNAAGEEVERAAQPVYTKIMSAATAQRLREYMVQVVESGTGTAAKPAEGGAGGKTGTAETGWIKDGRGVVQAWFTGFYPAADPKYAITILSEDGVSGGHSSGPVFKDIVDGIAKLKK